MNTIGRLGTCFTDFAESTTFEFSIKFHGLVRGISCIVDQEFYCKVSCIRLFHVLNNMK